MARTAGSDGTRTEAAIREAAIDMIADHGFEGMTLRSLASRAGLQAGSLYRYFPSKDELLYRIILAHMEDLLDRWDQLSPKSGGAQDHLSAFVEFHVRYHSDKPREVRIANMEIRSLAGAHRKNIVSLRRRYENILRQILENGVREKEFVVADITVATFAILAMLTGIASWYKDDGRLSKDVLVECYTDLVLSGLRGRSS